MLTALYIGGRRPPQCGGHANVKVYRYHILLIPLIVMRSTVNIDTRNIFRLNPRHETFSRIGVETQVLLIFNKTTKCTMNRVTYEMETQEALHMGMRNLNV
ncbi:uncharacterized protein [Dysidea avara]|uniref:uncharacterized protein n=1 Tax=Dysidea avara TaxID=196820 RepID=UPI00332CB811